MLTHEREHVLAGHRWRFQRAGGYDHVCLDTGADLVALPTLDQKLWAALACPTRGVEFDAHTLDLIDTDADGRIRAPEVLAAVDWALARLRDPDTLLAGGEALALGAIDTRHEDGPDSGRLIHACACEVLRQLGRAEAGTIELDDVADTHRLYATIPFNGDGVITAAAAGDDEALRAALLDVLQVCGGVPDRSGVDGIDRERLQGCFAALDALAAWRDDGGSGPVRPLGADTAAAAEALAAVQAKIDDYFLRCRLAAWDAALLDALQQDAGERTLAEALKPVRDAEALAALPLDRAAPGRPLDFGAALNPAWLGRLQALRAQVLQPLLGDDRSLDESHWEALKARFAPWFAWQAAQPHDGPATRLAALPAEALARLRDPDLRARLQALVERDEALSGQFAALAALERLIRYRRDLHRLLDNFVSLREFYLRRHRAIFQIGTLYLDGRSCELCIRVGDIARHALLAAAGNVCLVYCDCRRQEPGSGETRQQAIAAALTDGEVDELAEGRNGVFYDRAGLDWDASVVKIVRNPVSLRQAFWSPYRRFGQFLSTQIEKFANARAQDIDRQLAGSIGPAAAPAATNTAAPAPAAPAPARIGGFDIARFAGIFAALGLALGAIGTAIASVVTGLLALSPWQLPLVFAGVVLAISGPSLLMAWLKLRQRSLGPLLDATGWAINARARLGPRFGRSLTALPKLPAHAERLRSDPFAERTPVLRLGLLLLLLGVLAVGGWRAGWYDAALLDLRRWVLAHTPKPAAATVPAPAPPAAPAPAPR